MWIQIPRQWSSHGSKSLSYLSRNLPTRMWIWRKNVRNFTNFHYLNLVLIIFSDCSYGNDCELRVKNCQEPDGPRIRRAYDGECKSTNFLISVLPTINFVISAQIRSWPRKLGKNPIGSKSSKEGPSGVLTFCNSIFAKIEIFRLFGKVGFFGHFYVQLNWHIQITRNFIVAQTIDPSFIWKPINMNLLPRNSSENVIKYW